MVCGVLRGGLGCFNGPCRDCGRSWITSFIFRHPMLISIYRSIPLGHIPIYDYLMEQDALIFGV